MRELMKTTIDMYVQLTFLVSSLRQLMKTDCSLCENSLSLNKDYEDYYLIEVAKMANSENLASNFVESKT